MIPDSQIPLFTFGTSLVYPYGATEYQDFSFSLFVGTTIVAAGAVVATFVGLGAIIGVLLLVPPSLRSYWCRCLCVSIGTAAVFIGAVVATFISAVVTTFIGAVIAAFILVPSFIRFHCYFYVTAIVATPLPSVLCLLVPSLLLVPLLPSLLR